MDGPINEPVTEDVPGDRSRRDFLKRSAAVGVVAWSAPAILSLPGGGAWAGHYPCPCPNCDAEATAIRTPLGDLGHTEDGCTCTLNQTIGPVAAQVVCAEANDEHCTARTFLEGVRIELAPNTFLTASALSSCVTCGSGDSYVADLALLVESPLGDTETPLQLSASCNGTVLGLGDLATAIFNEQRCDNGVLTVNALRVTIGGQDIIIGQSKAGAEGCPCTACASDPRCEPPREQLCPAS